MILSRLPSGEPEIFATVQGEGPSCGVPSLFVRLSECNLKCTWCFVPDTPILMGDWTWKPLGDLSVGDDVLALSKPEGEHRHHQLTRAHVTRTARRRAATVIVNDDLRCTPDHQFWVTGMEELGDASHSGWRAVDRAIGFRVLFTASMARPAKSSLLDDQVHHPPASRVIRQVETTGRIEEVVTLSTTAGSFIAGGYVVKNCDTAYTWDWDKYDRSAQTIDLSVDDIVGRALQIAGTVRNAVFTGGEPLLQQQELAVLARELKAHGFRVEIETNGTVRPTDALASTVDQWNVSPKLENSGNPLRARRRAAALDWFKETDSAAFKFVVSRAEDIAEVNELVEALSIPPDRVILMPEGTDADTINERARWLADQCRTLGYRLGTRLHVLLWGATRGR